MSGPTGFLRPSILSLRRSARPWTLDHGGRRNWLEGLKLQRPARAWLLPPLCPAAPTINAPARLPSRGQPPRSPISPAPAVRRQHQGGLLSRGEALARGHGRLGQVQGPSGQQAGDRGLLPVDEGHRLAGDHL